MRPFTPLFRNPHLLTLAGNFWPRAIDTSRFPTRAVCYDTAPGTRILVEENRPAGAVLGEVLLHHGLEGSSRSGYLISLAQCLLEAGFGVHRMNMRGCGGTQRLTDTLYHSGLTTDARSILEQWRAAGRGPRFLAGFSLGGNVALKLAGELGQEGPALLAGVCAVSTPLDLHACVKQLDSPANWIYQRRFVLSLCRRYRTRHRLDPVRFPAAGLESVRTVYDFDDRFTAKAFQLGDAPNYYATQSAIRFLAAIRLPTLLIQAKDDPMIPFSIYETAAIGSNPHIRLLAAEHGGHLGFLSRSRPRFWLDPVIRDWFLELRNKAAPVIV